MQAIQEPATLSIDTILLATDFSAASEKAADYARGIARRFGSTLEMVHVVNPDAVSMYGEIPVKLSESEQKIVDAEAAAMAERPFVEDGVVTRTFSREGRDAAQTLLDTAHQRHSDLIVAGTQSKSVVGKLLLGSTAERLIRNAQCPVLTVGPKAQRPTENPLTFHRILYATDFSAQADKAATYALAFAKASSARLCYCYVEQTPADDPILRAEATEAYRNVLRQTIPDAAFDFCNPECFVEYGEPGDAILKLANRLDADLIVLGARKSSFWLNYIERGLTPSLLAEAKCPVLTVC